MEDKLALAATRPPMALGVPQNFALINLCLSAIIGVNITNHMDMLGDFGGIAIAILLYLLNHITVTLVTINDPRRLEVLLLWYKKIFIRHNYCFWGGNNSYAP